MSTSAVTADQFCRSDPLMPSPHAFSPNRWISIEGLALLALAERLGITVDAEVDTCPRLLRGASYAPFRSRGYPDRGID